MTTERMNPTGYDHEDAYFHQKDLELLAKKRAELDAQREDSTVDTLKRPRCGSDTATHSKPRGFFRRLLQTAFETPSRRHEIADPDERP